MAASVAMASALALACLLLAAPLVSAQPFLAGQGLAPLGNLRTTDKDGPYRVTKLTTQTLEVQAGLVARKDFTDKDIFDFLTATECLEGIFDTFGTFGRNFPPELLLGGPTPIGARKANLSNRTLAFLEEVALNEQGHALLTRQAGSKVPCPFIDYTRGWNEFMAAAFELNGTVEEAFGSPYDPFLNDVNFVLSVLTLEELGATGNKGLSLLVVNPVHANAIAGLATSATAHAAVERFLLWELRDEIVAPFGETAQKVFARVSALRDRLDGRQLDDQGIVNTDPRTIAVPNGFVNMIPTDVRGLTFSRTPQQNLNILTLGSRNGKGGFFPRGIPGRINKPTGFDRRAPGLDDFRRRGRRARVAPQQSRRATGPLPQPITGPTPAAVPGQEILTQCQSGPRETQDKAFRGYTDVPATCPGFDSNATTPAQPPASPGADGPGAPPAPPGLETPPSPPASPGAPDGPGAPPTPSGPETPPSPPAADVPPAPFQPAGPPPPPFDDNGGGAAGDDVPPPPPLG